MTGRSVGARRRGVFRVLVKRGRDGVEFRVKGWDVWVLFKI